MKNKIILSGGYYEKLISLKINISRYYDYPSLNNIEKMLESFQYFRSLINSYNKGKYQYTTLNISIDLSMFFNKIDKSFNYADPKRCAISNDDTGITICCNPNLPFSTCSIDLDEVEIIITHDSNKYREYETKYREYENKLKQKSKVEQTKQDPEGIKLDQDKLRYGLLAEGMPNALKAIVEVLEFGAKKYKPHNWQKVDNGLERYKEAFYRHALNTQGDLFSKDVESGLQHLAHAVINGLFLLELYNKQNKKD